MIDELKTFPNWPAIYYVAAILILCVIFILCLIPVYRRRERNLRNLRSSGAESENRNLQNDTQRSIGKKCLQCGSNNVNIWECEHCHQTYERCSDCLHQFSPCNCDTQRNGRRDEGKNAGLAGKESGSYDDEIDGTCLCQRDERHETIVKKCKGCHQHVLRCKCCNIQMSPCRCIEEQIAKRILKENAANKEDKESGRMMMMQTGSNDEERQVQFPSLREERYESHDAMYGASKPSQHRDATNYNTSCSSKAEEEQVADEIDALRRDIERIKSQREDQMRSIALSSSPCDRTSIRKSVQKLERRLDISMKLHDALIHKLKILKGKREQAYGVSAECSELEGLTSADIQREKRHWENKSEHLQCHTVQDGKDKTKICLPSK